MPISTGPLPPSAAAAPMARRLAGLAQRVSALSGWRARGLALVGGVVSNLAMAPVHLWPVLFLTLAGFVWQIDGAVARGRDTPAPAGWRRHLARPAVRAAAIGWWFAFGYFFVGLLWIGDAFLVEAEVFAVLLPFAVTLMPAGLALFWAGATAVASRAWQPGPARVLALALALALAEWLRGHVLTGFPWNVIGYALTMPLPLMQSAAVLGIYGLSLVTVFIAALPAVLAADLAAGRVPSWWRPAVWLVPLVPLLAMAAWGSLRLAQPPPPEASPVMVRIVQPSVPQREKWRPENQQRIFAQHLDLSRRNAAGVVDGARGVGLIVWPEAAMPFLPLARPDALEAIGRLLPDGAHLASGALRLERAPAGQGDGRPLVFNSLLVFGAGGRLAAAYDKIHLVPFGEYLPLQATLEAIGLEQLSRLRGGFQAGPSPRPLLRLPGLPPLGPLVCYEAIFPAAVVQGAQRPAALLNITNDGWFGDTTGPRQHLHQARVRAVEEGLPLIRAANNGISAVIDAQGRVLARLDLDRAGVIDAALPPALAPPFYARNGDLAFWLLVVLASLGLTVCLRLRPA